MTYITAPGALADLWRSILAVGITANTGGQPILRGKLTIVFMLLLGLLAATLAWWHNRARTDRVLVLWGGRIAHLIHTGDQVTLFCLAPADVSRDTGRAGLEYTRADFVPGTELGLKIVKQRDISKVPGLVHARQALIQNASYDWAAAVSTNGNWQYALRFASDEAALTFLFDLEQGLVTEPTSGTTASIQPIRPGLERFFREQFTEPTFASGR